MMWFFGIMPLTPFDRLPTVCHTSYSGGPRASRQHPETEARTVRHFIMILPAIVVSLAAIATLRTVVMQIVNMVASL